MQGNSGKVKTVRTKPRKPWSVELADSAARRQEKKAKKHKRKEQKHEQDQDC